MSLYLTPSRKAFLWAVEAGSVARYQNGQDYHRTAGVKLSARCDECQRAGWVELGDLEPDGKATWRLTAAGKAVLSGAADDAIWRELR